LYDWLGGPNGSVLGCQIAIEVLMLLLYLFARTLARKAFGRAPSYEARTLFMFLLLSDGARAPGLYQLLRLVDYFQVATYGVLTHLFELYFEAFFPMNV
jgi:hypothetical protein